MNAEDDLDNFDGMSEPEIREELFYLARTTGAAKAIRTSMAVCDDKKAPAAARVQAASNILRVGGFFAAHEPAGEKELSEMTPGELRMAIRQAESAMKRRTSGSNKPVDGSGPSQADTTRDDGVFD